MLGRPVKLVTAENAFIANTNSQPIRTALIAIANAGPDVPGIQAVFNNNKAAFNHAALNAVADFNDVNDLAELQQTQTVAKYQAVLKTLQELPFTLGNLNTAQALAQVGNSGAEILAYLNPNKNNLGLGALVDFNGLSEAQLQEIRRLAAVKHKEFCVFNAIDALQYGDAAQRRLVTEISSEADDRRLEQHLIRNHRALFNLTQIEAANLLNGLGAKIPAFRDAASARTKLFAVMDNVTGVDNTPNTRRALGLIVAASRLGEAQLRASLDDANNKADLRIADPALQLTANPIPTYAQLDPLVNLLLNQHKVFNALNAIDSLPGNAAAPAFLTAIAADANPVEITNALNANTAALNLPGMNFNDVSDRQKNAIYNAALKKHQEITVRLRIPAIANNDNSPQIRAGLLAIQAAPDDATRRAALVAHSGTLGLVFNDFAPLLAPELANIQTAADAKYKQLQAHHVIKSFADFNNVNARNRLNAIATAVDAATINELNNSNAVLGFGIANFVNLPLAEFAALREEAGKKHKELTALNRIVNFPDRNTQPVRDALSAIAANPTIAVINANQAALTLAIPDFAGISDEQRNNIGQAASRKHKELVVLAAIPALAHNNDAARNQTLRNVLDQLRGPAPRLDKIASLNTNKALLGFDAIADFNNLEQTQIDTITTAANLKYRELHALNIISTLGNTPAIRGAIAAIAAAAPPLGAPFVAILNANKDALGLLAPFDFNGFDTLGVPLQNIHDAAVSKNRELLLLEAINLLDQPEAAGGAGDVNEALLVLNNLNPPEPDVNLRRTAIRRYIYSEIQGWNYINPAAFGLNGIDAHDTAILSNDLIDKIQIAASAKIQAIRPLAEPNHNLLSELRSTLNAAKPTRADILNVLDRVRADINANLPNAELNVSEAIRDLAAQLRAAPPAPPEITDELSRAIKTLRLGLEQHLIAAFITQLERGLPVDNALLVIVNTHVDRMLRESGLNQGHPLRSELQNLRNSVKTMVGDAALSDAEKTQRLRLSTLQLKEVYEKQQLLSLTLILRQVRYVRRDQDAEVIAALSPDLRVLLPNLIANDGLRVDHPFKQPDNLLQNLNTALIALKNIPDGLHNDDARKYAQTVAGTALTALRAAIKNLTRDTRTNAVVPELETKVTNLAPQVKRDMLARGVSIDTLRKQLDLLKDEAIDARRSRHRDKALSDINARVEALKISAYVYLKEMEKLNTVIPLNVAQTQHARALSNLLTVEDPYAPGFITNANILAAVQALVNSLPANHFFRTQFQELERLAALPDNVSVDHIRAAKNFIDGYDQIQNANVDAYAASMVAFNNKSALNNLRIAEIRDEIIPQADVILGKSERAAQKPIKIGSASGELVKAAEVVESANIEATVQRLLGEDPGPAQAAFNSDNGRVKDFNGNTHAKVILIEANARKNPSFFGIAPVTFKVAMVHRNDTQGNHVGEFRFNPNEISRFTLKDTYTKMAITSIEDYILSHATRPKQIAIKGNLKEELVWEMMLYCQHQGIKPVNKTRHTELTERFNEMMQEPPQNRTALNEFAARARRLFPDQPKIYTPITQRVEMDRQMRPGLGR